ncbi:MAG: hypothetical protein HUU06_13180 [Planctomycetaceae bacterium]|nr:hypothetical protein [Planctomycetaceae bacterium]
MRERGFVLTPTYRVARGRAEVHLHAVMEGGEAAVIVDDRMKPYFFVRRREAEAARRGGGRVVESGLRTLDGETVARVEGELPQELSRVRDSLEARGVECFEADLRFASRYLIDRGIRGAFSVEGAFERRGAVGRVYRNPRIEGAHFVPRLRVLSLDIETSLDGERLYAIGVAGAGGERVFLLRDGNPGLPGYVEVFGEEGALLARFLEHVREADPDVLTGWSLPDFDLPALQRYCRRAGLVCALGRTREEVVLRRDPGFTREGRAVLSGRVVLDGLALVRGAFVRLDDYRLETAAQALLGRGKLLGPDGKGASIEAAYRDDPALLCEYNLEDARLVLEIIEKAGLVELTVRRSLLTGMPLDRVSALPAEYPAWMADFQARDRFVEGAER